MTKKQMEEQMSSLKKLSRRRPRKEKIHRWPSANHEFVLPAL